MKFNLRVIASIMGLLLAVNGGFMLLCLPFSFYYNEDPSPLIFSSAISIAAGLPFWLMVRGTKELKRRDGFLIVTLGWVVMSLSGSLPYVFANTLYSYTDIFFETMSGYTTTGATIIDDIAQFPKGLLLWRSLTQWIGGMGIIVLAVAILPILGIGGMQLFMAEAPGISADKFKPRIKDEAIRLWTIYLLLTLLQVIILILSGVNFFDALNHSFTTLSSGGFSTHNNSIGYYTDPFIHYVFIFFMFLAGTNFTLTYFLLKGRVMKVIKNEEFKYYTITLLILTIVCFVILILKGDEFERSFRQSLFSIVSIVTTTGFTIADYTLWGPFLILLFFAAFFVGGSAGSTAGGVKVVRHVILFKNSILEMKRQLHPSAIIPVRLNKKAVDREITYNVIGFIMMYFFVFAIGTLLMSLFGIDFKTSMGAVASSLGNIGPGIGAVGPAATYAALPDLAKWFLAFLMLLGRLEIYTVLILFTPYFWRLQ